MKRVWFFVLSVLSISTLAYAQQVCTKDGCTIGGFGPETQSESVSVPWGNVPADIQKAVRTGQNLSQTGTVVLLFSQQDCIPCRELEKVLVQNAKLMDLWKTNGTKVYEWNVTKGTGFKSNANFRVHYTPAAAFFKDGVYQKLVTYNGNVGSMAAQIMKCSKNPRFC